MYNDMVVQYLDELYNFVAYVTELSLEIRML